MVTSTSADIADRSYSLSAFASRSEQKSTKTRDEVFADTASDSGSAGDRSMYSMSQHSSERAAFERSPGDAMVASPASARGADAEARSESGDKDDEDDDEYAMGVEDEDGGMNFKSRSTGERWTRYYEHNREAYFYVNATTRETTWDHPDSDEYLEEKAAHDTVTAQKALNSAMTAYDEKIDAKFTKLCIVNERWLEKYPPAVPIPTRPKDFKGVYGTEDEFWDPEADSHSIDNNEGSERGDNVFEDAYEAEDSLARVTSAVDLATPEELRPLGVARAYLDLVLDLALDLVDDDDNHARAKVLAEEAAAEAVQTVVAPHPVLKMSFKEPASKSGKLKSMRSVRSIKQQNIIVAQTNANGPSELSMRDAFERMRAKYRNTIGDARLKFKDDGAADDVEDAIFSRRLHAPYDQVISTGLRIEDFTHASDDDDDDDDDDKRTDYSDSEFTRKDLASLRSSKSKARSPSSRLRDEEDARIEAEGKAEYAAAQKLKEEDVRERRGLIARLAKSMSKASREKRAAKRQAKKDAKQLAEVGYIAPWELRELERAVEHNAPLPATESDSDSSAVDS